MSARITDAMVEAALKATMFRPTEHTRTWMRAALEAGLSTEPGEAEGWQPTHRHKKRGSTYRVVAEGRLQVDADLDNEKVVVYRGEDGQVWVRPTYEFNDGRFEALASVPAPSGAIKIDDVDRDMIARGDRIGADLQRALLKFYDDHAIPSSEAEPKAKRVQHRVRPHKKAEWGPWIDGYVPKDYLGWFEQREVAPQAVPAEDVAKQPLSRMSADDGRPMWEQISDLIKFHMNERPPIRLRDELVTILAWARYGEARAIASEAAAPLPEDTNHGR